jgi:hypothetical protein
VEWDSYREAQRQVYLLVELAQEASRLLSSISNTIIHSTTSQPIGRQQWRLVHFAAGKSCYRTIEVGILSARYSSVWGIP